MPGPTFLGNGTELVYTDPGTGGPTGIATYSYGTFSPPATIRPGDQLFIYVRSYVIVSNLSGGGDAEPVTPPGWTFLVGGGRFYIGASAETVYRGYLYTRTADGSALDTPDAEFTVEYVTTGLNIIPTVHLAAHMFAYRNWTFTLHSTGTTAATGNVTNAASLTLPASSIVLSSIVSGANDPPASVHTANGFSTVFSADPPSTFPIAGRIANLYTAAGGSTPMIRWNTLTGFRAAWAAFAVQPRPGGHMRLGLGFGRRRSF